MVDNASTRGPRSINTNTQSSSRYEKFSAEVSRGRTSDHHSPHQSTTVLTTDKITAGVVRTDFFGPFEKHSRTRKLKPRENNSEFEQKTRFRQYLDK